MTRGQRIILQEGSVDMRTEYEKQLSELKSDMIELCMATEQAIRAVTDSLLNGDIIKAGTIKNEYEEISSRERDIEALCLRIIMKQQPVATDLRDVSAALKMVTDLDRMGNQAEEISEIIRVGNVKVPEKDLHFDDMSEATVKMVSESIDSFVKKDENLANTVIKYDDVVDNYFNDIKNLLIQKVKDNAIDAESMTDYLMIAKYYERIGDHAVNVAQWVLFSLGGDIEK